MNNFESHLPEHSRYNVEARLHAVCCIYLRLLDPQDNIPDFKFQLLDQIHELMIYDWNCPDLFLALDVDITPRATTATLLWSSPHPELAEFLNELEPAHCILHSDDVLTDD